MAKQDTPTVEHLAWVIDGRAKSQKTSLKLYGLMKEHKQQIRKKKRSKAVQDLADVSFSLWRAVFLADRTGQTEAKMKHAKMFIAKVLTDNAIAFAQDRLAREWTFNYYVENALFRLERCCLKYWPALKNEPLRPPKGERTPQRRWDYLQEVFEKAVDQLEAELTAKKSS